jgi:hypothetical protein
MTTKAQIGAGTSLNRGDGATPEVFTSVGEIVGTLKGPSLTRDMKDATNMSSPNQREEVIPGILKTGTVDFDVSYVRGNVQHAGLVADIKNAVLRNFQLIFPDDPTNPVTFSAYVQKAELSVPVEDKRMLGLSLKISGDFAGL